MEPQNIKPFLEEGDSNQMPERVRWNSTLSTSTQQKIAQDADLFLHQSLSSPCLNVVERCKDIYIYDSDGREYIDMHGNSVHQVGFGNEYVMQRVREQMEILPFSPRRYANSTATALAQKLIDITPPGLDKLLFTPSGALAVGLALKIARMVTGRFKTISMYDAFHGASLDAISVGGEQLFRNDLGPLMAGGILVPPFDSYRGFMGKNRIDSEEILLDYIEYVIEKEGDVACLLVEPIRSTVVHVPTHKFWQKVRQICTDYGVVLIFDEIPTCMGRTGEMFACQGFGVSPDILVIGKGFGGGIIPMAATVVRKEYDVAANRALGHYTFEKNPLGSAAALATIEFVEQQNLLEHVRELGAQVEQHLVQLKDRYQSIGDVRGRGLLWAIELVEDREMKTPAVGLASRVMYRCLERGVSFKVSGGSVLTLTPALTITAEKLFHALNIIEQSIAEG